MTPAIVLFVLGALFGFVIGACVVIVLDVVERRRRQRARGYVTVTNYATTGTGPNQVGDPYSVKRRSS